MRVSLSQKVFITFFSLTFLTLVLGAVVFFGIADLHQLEEDAALLDDFQLQVKELQITQLRLQVSSEPTEGHDEFNRQFQKTVTLTTSFDDLLEGLSPAQQFRAKELGIQLKNFHTAYRELSDKYERDRKYFRQKNEYRELIEKEVSTLSSTEWKRTYPLVHELLHNLDSVYHERTSKLFKKIEKELATIVQSTGNYGIVHNASAMVKDAKANYLNFLAIQDREQFLTESSDVFLNFAQETVDFIRQTNFQRELWLNKVISIIAIFAVLATIIWWFVVHRYFQAFLSNQARAIEALRSPDAKMPPFEVVSDDELGDLTQVMQDLAKQLQASKSRYQTLVENVNLGITLISKDFEVLTTNSHMREMFRKTNAPCHGKPCFQEFGKRNEVCDNCPGRRAMALGVPAEIEKEGIRDDGSTFYVRIQAFPVTDEDGNPDGFIEVVEDITERKLAEKEKRNFEKQLQHVQKLESLGVLAGGIAHDFNNILMVVLGNADLAMTSLPPFSPARENILEIEKASRRAADLCKQMLAYSGKGKFVVQPINLSDLVEEMTHMLRISISKNVVVKYNLAEHLPAVEGDPSQIQQVVMNLIINASEAIGKKSGVISITTGAMACDQKYLSSLYLAEHFKAGPYVYLEIADNGCGMDEETVAKIFDPFFTTKFTGRGLGMSAVLGIIRGHRGGLKIYSEPGVGTTFKVFFPALEGVAAQEVDRESQEDKEWRGGGLVLLVDDDDTVLVVGKQMLEFLGFEVITAADGMECLEQFKQHQDKIVCTLLDLTMPHMSGDEAYRELRKMKPDVCVIMSSGYNEQEVTQRFMGKGLAGFIQKPYTIQALKTVFRKALTAKS